MEHGLKALVVVVLVAWGVPSDAAVITSLAEGTLRPFSAFEDFGDGPISENGFTWTSTNSTSVYGFTSSYVLNENGVWKGLPAFIGLNADSKQSGVSQYMTITFDNPVSAVLANLSYAKLGSDFAPAMIEVYGNGGQFLEQYELDFTTGSASLNTGFDFGFQRNGNVIKSFVLRNAYMVARDLRTATMRETVPEPGTLALLGLGLAGLGLSRRRNAA